MSEIPKHTPIHRRVSVGADERLRICEERVGRKFLKIQSRGADAAGYVIVGRAGNADEAFRIQTGEPPLSWEVNPPECAIYAVGDGAGESILIVSEW